jgi:hypothetical protein
LTGFGLCGSRPKIEEPCSKLQGIFGRKDFLSNFDIHSLTPQQAAGNALAVAVQDAPLCEQGGA